MNLMVEDADPDPLCCCEYYDFKNERSHILTCCCNCDVLDELATRILCCRSVDKKLKREVWMTIKDRLRCPYPGGAKQMSFLDIAAPFFLIVICHGLAIFNLYSTAVVVISVMALLFFIRRRYFTGHRTNFFFLCLAWSYVYLILLYQICVPIYEILPEENLILVFFMLLTLFTYLRFKKCVNDCDGGLIKSYQPNHLSSQNFDNDATTVLIPNCDRDNYDDDDENDEDGCSDGAGNNKERDATATDCIENGEYKIWLDSYLTPTNHRLYMAGCCFAVLALLIYSNLVITSVCHPIPVMQIFSVDILLPDDCTDVYDQYDSALSFSGGLHALLLAFFIAGKLAQHILFVTQDGVIGGGGVNGFMGQPFPHPLRFQERTSRKSCISNWKSFLCN